MRQAGCAERAGSAPSVEDLDGHCQNSTLANYKRPRAYVFVDAVARNAAGKILRLASRGLPRVGRSTRGDLHLQIVVEVPEQLTDAQRDTLSEWAASLPPASRPRRADFDRALQERQ